MHRRLDAHDSRILSIEIRQATAAVQAETIQKSLDEIRGDQRWLIRLVAAAIIGAVLTFLTYAELPDALVVIGTPHVRTVAAVAGTSNILTVTGSGVMPQAEDALFFGPVGQDSFEAIVTATEATEDRLVNLHSWGYQAAHPRGWSAPIRTGE